MFPLMAAFGELPQEGERELEFPTRFHERLADAMYGEGKKSRRQGERRGDYVRNTSGNQRCFAGHFESGDFPRIFDDTTGGSSMRWSMVNNRCDMSPTLRE